MMYLRKESLLKDMLSKMILLSTQLGQEQLEGLLKSTTSRAKQRLMDT